MTQSQLEDLIVQLKDQYKRLNYKMGVLEKVFHAEKERADKLEKELESIKQTSGMFNDVFKNKGVNT